jgi:phenylpropionate dioxygenase-like ring-hydroxylating dioxygenase large terminal subunit
MQGLLSPTVYCDPAHFALEHETLFRDCWVFVGLQFELKGLAHSGVRVGATDVLLQVDASGKPRAFLNVCSHRHAQLCKVGRHEGAVRCPYHGWVYDREGVPVGIPQRHAFPAVVAAPEAHRLVEFACETAGEFMFVRLASTGKSLEQYLGQEFEFLVDASKGMNKVLDEFRGDVASNWKVAIENSLEGYHVPAVHQQTLMQAGGMQTGLEAASNNLSHPPHSVMNHEADPVWLARFARSVEPKIGRWPWRFEHYTHHLIFPNLTVTSFMGYSFHVQVFEPSAVDRTAVHSRTVGVAFEGQSPVGAKLIEQILADGHAFTHRVFDEDGGICAKVQAGLAQAVRPAMLGDGIEDRVEHFQRAYVSSMPVTTRP